jgi:hypothetical protein
LAVIRMSKGCTCTIYRYLVPIALGTIAYFALVPQTQANEARNDVFSIISVPRSEALEGSTDDFYYRLSFVYSNVRNDPDDSFWKSVRSFFVDEDSKIVFQVQQEVLSGAKSVVKASKVLGLFDKSEELVSSDVAYEEQLVPARRFQNSDRVKIRVSLSEVTKERASAVREVISQLSNVPLVSSFSQGALTTLSTVLDTLTGLTSDAGTRQKVATYTLHGTNALANVGHVAVVATGDDGKFQSLASNPDNLPKTINEFNVADKSNLPSYVLLRVDAIDSLYSPTQIISQDSPVRPLIQNQLEAMRNAEKTIEKAQKCVELRSAANYLGPLSSLDEGYAAMAALAAANYNPDQSAHHENEGCLTFQEIEHAKAKYPAFRIGTCLSSKCRVANQFMNQWLQNRSSGVAANNISWTAVLDGKLIQGFGDESAFRSELQLRRRWGDLKAEDSTTYQALGTMFGTKNDQACTFDIAVSIGLLSSEGSWKASSINITETDDTIDGLRPSSPYKGLARCSG